MPTSTAIAWECDIPEPIIFIESTTPEVADEIPNETASYHPQVPQLRLEAEIERSKEILELQDDWDGEGAVGYSPATLDRAILFLKEHRAGLWRSYGSRLPVPTIGPGPVGSIDLYWKQRDWELLINIPADIQESATFYGNKYGSQKIKGAFDPAKFTSAIAVWLMA